jgi:hypothetical protein
MLATAAPRTIIEHWMLRRHRLADAHGVPEQHRLMQIQVLDYLINRYRDSPDVARPSRCLTSTDVYWDERAIVVHHHLGRGRVAGVKDRREAERRVRHAGSHAKHRKCGPRRGKRNLTGLSFPTHGANHHTPLATHHFRT